MPFFAHVVRTRGDAGCQEPDVIGAVGAGLALSRGEKENIPIIEQSQRLAFGTCWPATRKEVMRRFSLATNAYFVNVCELLKAKENLTLDKQMMCERASDAPKSDVHVPATPLDGSRWRIEVVPDQVSAVSGAKSLLETVEFAKVGIAVLSKQRFSSAPIEYSGEAGAGIWTARQWASPKMKAEWHSQIGGQNTMKGSLTMSNPTAPHGSIHLLDRKKPPEK